MYIFNRFKLIFFLIEGHKGKKCFKNQVKRTCCGFRYRFRTEADGIPYIELF
jgi:hypothetical protein